MAWTDLKAAVAAVIKTNNNQEITGALLQSTLNSIIDQVGANASYKGVAIPSTSPGSPDGPVFYIASTQGTYANFGGFVLDGGFAVLSNVSGSWTGTKFLKTEMDAKVDKVTDIEQVRSQATNKVPSSKLLDDEITKIINLGALYKGIATPTTDPGTPNGNVFYIGVKTGIYSNFNAIKIELGEIAFLKWNGTNWTKESINKYDGSLYSFVENNLFDIGSTYEKKINTPVKAGVKLSLKVSNVSVAGTGAFNVNVTGNDGTTLLIKYGSTDQTVEINLSNDYDWIKVQLGFQATITAFTADVEVRYGFANEINTNKTNIATNATNIATNATNIATNATNLTIAKKDITTFVLSESLNIAGTYIVTKQLPLKAGQKIRLKVSNVSVAGTGAFNVNILDSNNNYLIIKYGLTNQVIDFTIITDATSFKVQLVFEQTITAFTADVEVRYGMAVELEKNYQQIEINRTNIATNATNIATNATNLTIAKKDITTFVLSESLNIAGTYIVTKQLPLKAGQKIRLKVSNVSVAGTGAFNVNVTGNDGTTLLIKYGSTDQTVEINLSNDYDGIKVQLGFQATITAFTADVEVRYGMAVELENNYQQIEINRTNIATNATNISTNATNIATNTDDINTNKKALLVTGLQHIYYNTVASTDWLYGVGVYFGYNKPVLKDCLLDSITMSLFSVTTSHIGTTRQFVIGTVDQRNWLLPRLIVDCPISAVTSGKATFDFTALKIIMNAGEVVFAVSAPISASASLGLNTSTYDSNNQLLTTTSLSNALVAKTTTNANIFQMNVLDIDSVFATKGAIDSINTKISALNQKAATINLYSDYITGDKYELKIVNGQIVVQSLDFGRILVIGHSFVTYGNSPEADWYLDDGESRAMAASINAHQWTTFVKDKFGATLTLKGGVDFERNYSQTYNFATNWAVTDNYDAICVYLNENAVYNTTMQASWEAMLNYLKSAAPSAKIYCTGSWSADDKQAAIQAACNAVPNITYVDLVGLNTANNRWKRGDYYFGRESSYYPMGAANGHPNDKGHLDIANGFLLNMGQDQLSGFTHNITLVQATGGTIETPNITWVKDGVATIRINPTAGYNLSSLNVVTAGGQTIATTQRTNNYYDGTNRIYYTFIMPDDNVTVTPVWLLN